jgi:GNAT superfamily N-acetyltransferase
MLIREARQEDGGYMADACIQVARFMRQGAVDKYIVGFPDKANADMAKWAKGFVADTKRFAFVAEAPGGERIGCIFGKIEESNMPTSVSEEVGTISVCWVDSNHRRSGVGRALLAETEKWFLARGIRHLEVAFMAKNETAREAWAHLGFVPFRVLSYKEISEQQGGGYSPPAPRSSNSTP